jgi:hypothetical protein
VRTPLEGIETQSQGKRIYLCSTMSAVSEEQVGAVGRLLINPARPLKERFRALFTLKNIGGPLALDWIIKVGISVACLSRIRIFSIPDPHQRILIKYFNPKNCF